MADPKKLHSSGITPDMTVLDIIHRHRETESVFRRYDDAAGECICCTSLFDSLYVLSEKYNIDLEKLTGELTASFSP